MNERVSLGTLSVGFVHCLAEAVRECGREPEPLLQRYGLTPERLARPDERLSIARYMHLGKAAIDLCNEPALGLRMGRHLRLGHLGLAGVTAMQAPSVAIAADTLLQFEPLYAQNYRGRSQLQREAAGSVWLQFHSIGPYNDFNRFVVDTLLCSWRHQLGDVAGERIDVQLVEIEFEPPAHAARYESAFDCPVRFGAAANRLQLSASTQSLRGREHCPGTYSRLRELCEEELLRKTRVRSQQERVIQAIGPLLHGREPDLEEVAARLQLAPWTLRRKLADEGTRFRTLLNDTRRDLATAYIRDTELRFGEIAYLLGFASSEAFQRAFKRWCGTTPGDYRRMQRYSP